MLVTKQGHVHLSRQVRTQRAVLGYVLRGREPRLNLGKVQVTKHTRYTLRLVGGWRGRARLWILDKQHYSSIITSSSRSSSSSQSRPCAFVSLLCKILSSSIGANIAPAQLLKPLELALSCRVAINALARVFTPGKPASVGFSIYTSYKIIMSVLALIVTWWVSAAYHVPKASRSAWSVGLRGHSGNSLPPSCNQYSNSSLLGSYLP